MNISNYTYGSIYSESSSISSSSTILDSSRTDVLNRASSGVITSGCFRERRLIVEDVRLRQHISSIVLDILSPNYVFEHRILEQQSFVDANSVADLPPDLMYTSLLSDRRGTGAITLSLLSVASSSSTIERRTFFPHELSVSAVKGATTIP